MKVISVTLVGALVVLVWGLVQQASARAATGVNPRHILNNKHLHSRGSSSSSVLADVRAKYPLLSGARDALPPYPQDPLHAQEDDDDKAEDHLLDEDDDDEDEEEEEDDDDQDFEWSAEDLDMIKQKILDGLGLTSIPSRSKVGRHICI